MKSDSILGAESLIAERNRLENLLQASEDWRALQQLRSRTARGEGLSTVSSPHLEAMLVDALAENPFYGPYRSICLAIDKLSKAAAPANAAVGSAKGIGSTADDLTRIRGIDAALARRLKDIEITTFAEISDWRSADIQKVSSDLNLGKQIYGQNWIEQAALLALSSPNKAPVKAAAKKPVTEGAPTPPAVAPAQPAGPSKGATAAGGQPIGVPDALPDVDPNQLSLNFNRAAPAATPAKPVPAVSAPVVTLAASSSVKPAATQVQAPQKPVSQTHVSPTPGRQGPIIQAPITQASPVPVSAKQVPPPQPPPAKPSSATAVAPPPAAERPIGPPPKPLVPWRYGRAPADKPVTVAASEPAVKTAAAPGLQSAEPLPPPLKITAIAPSAAAAVPAAPVRPLRDPPRPLVVTRASLPPREMVAATPSSGARAKTPAAPVPPAATPPALPSRSAPALPPSAAQAASAVPSMSIAEAIAYAAEIARQGQRPGEGAPPAPSSAGSALAKPAAATQPAVQIAKPAPQTPVKPPAVKPPVVPPPLPASFVAPEPPPPPPPPRQVKIEHARPVEREDFSNRSNIEEASVEIVRRPVSNSPAVTVPHATPPVAPQTVVGPAVAAAPSPAQAALKTADETAPEAAAKSEPRGPTPIGRFLKALTGN